MNQIVILSGKGGTGKTSVTASFAALCERSVLADTDVDAADLHLVLAPRVRETHSFHSMPRATIDPETCTRCGECLESCRYGAISEEFEVDELACEGCRLCVEVCPADAARLTDPETGEWYVSDTRYGPLVHARLGVGQENSGKLVTTVKNRAVEIASDEGLDWVIVDGPPGIGCPVISSLAGADLALVVSEPTVSGIHDMERAVSVARHFGVRVACATNKFDINAENTNRVEDWCRSEGIPVLGRIPYDKAVTEAMIRGLPVVEHKRDGAARAIRALWGEVENLLNAHG
jgi:MinD superfamily P-loop ATPase